MLLSIILPTYNEKENIELMIKSLTEVTKKNNIKAIITVVDDNSPDNTGEIVDKIKITNKIVHIVHRKNKEGLGKAYLSGMNYSLNQKADLIMTMDCDFSHNPNLIPNFLKKIEEGYDLVLGSRYIPGGGVHNWPIHRKIISWGGNFLPRLVLGLRTFDNTTGFRCYKREVLEALNLDNIKSNGYSFLVEIAYLIQKKGFKIGETPILFKDRIHGDSKISKKEIFRTLKTLARLKFKL
ncbi:MAG: dolichyl-phosphate beta-D-mannosyltransferase [Nanoarchaeota archaeon]|nr:dolichyl-phosphate beta-D-mannosyltransferase [Nanoarchaeota archaeon]|tara:strand:+ start:1015 stop:1728 length:714 start_codon:yes stop_codon:yes gene_type:complete